MPVTNDRTPSYENRPLGFELRARAELGAAAVGSVEAAGQAAELGLAPGWVLSAVDGTSTDGLGCVDTLTLLDSAKREAVAKHAAARSELFGDAPGEDGEGGTLLLWFTAPPEVRGRP